MWLIESNAVLQEVTIVISKEQQQQQHRHAAAQKHNLRRDGEHGEDPVARQPGAIQTKNATIPGVLVQMVRSIELADSHGTPDLQPLRPESGESADRVIKDRGKFPSFFSHLRQYRVTVGWRRGKSSQLICLCFPCGARTRAYPVHLHSDHGGTSQGWAGEGKRGEMDRVADRLGLRGP